MSISQPKKTKKTIAVFFGLIFGIYSEVDHGLARGTEGMRIPKEASFGRQAWLQTTSGEIQIKIYFDLLV